MKQPSEAYLRMRSLRAAFKAADFAIYEVVTPANGGAPRRRYSRTVAAFIAAAQADWNDPFDWTVWAVSEEGERLCSSKEAVQQATPAQLCKLLTTVLRREHFDFGTIGRLIQSGYIMAVLDRIDALARP